MQGITRAAGFGPKGEQNAERAWNFLYKKAASTPKKSALTSEKSLDTLLRALWDLRMDEDLRTGLLLPARAGAQKCLHEIATAFKMGYERIEWKRYKNATSRQENETKGIFFLPLQQDKSTHRSFLSLPSSFFFFLLGFLSCREIILSLLTPMEPQMCQYELTGWKRKTYLPPAFLRSAALPLVL